MRRSTTLIVALCAAAFVVSCRDNSPTGTLPSTPRGAPRVRKADAAPGTCTTLNNIIALVNTVFSGGGPNANSVLGKLDNLDKKLQKGDIAGAQDRARDIVSFIQQKQSSLTATPAQIQLLINSILCYAGLLPNSFLVLPSDQPQVLVNTTGNSGVSLPANSVGEPTIITVTALDPSAPSPLITKLDKYPTNVILTQSSPLIQPVVVGVCPASGIPADVRARLRLGHQATAGFELPPAAPGFLDCTAVASASQSRMPGWLRALASSLSPKALYAKQEEFSRGVGATVTEFSPFGTVDPELFESKGVGSTVTEFQRVPAGDSTKIATPATPDGGVKGASGAAAARLPASGGSLRTVVAGQCTVADALPGQEVESECRPFVLIKTFQGTVMQNVPVGWSIGLGGGSVASVATGCDPFGTTAATTTGTDGAARACWKLGTTGENTVIATPTAGGDAPVGVTFSPASRTFTATGLQITPTVSATGGPFIYDASAHGGSGTCSNGLTPELTYNSASAPVDVRDGDYVLTVTCGAGNPLYVTVTATAPISITPAPTVSAVDCPVSVGYDGLPKTPCTASVTGPGLGLTPTPSYSANTNVGPVTASIAYAGGGNYQASGASASFEITAAGTVTSVTCLPGSVPYTGTARTPCTATVTGAGLSLTPTPTYTANVNVGPVTASVSYLGGGNWAASSGSAMFQIVKAATMSNVTCPTSVSYTGAAVTPCSGSASGPLLSTSVTPTYSNNTLGTATATVNYLGAANYEPSSASKTFKILYVQSGCFASPIAATMPSTTASQNPRKGNNVTVKCRLLNALGKPVVTAKGDLLVQDKGTNGLGAGVTVVSRLNTFTVSDDHDFDADDGFYTYVMPTSPTAFVAGHYYLVTATWNDGSTTTGWFYLKP